MNKSLTAIILSAGEGNRAKEHYPDIPKALIPVCGLPMAEYLDKILKGSGLFKTVFFNVRLEDERFFHDYDAPLLLEEKPYGNAGALRKFSEYLSNPFLAHHCDVFSDINYRKLYETFLENNALATMTLATPKKPGSFGVPQLKKNRIVGFRREEKASKLVNAGVYFFKREAISLIEDGFQDLDKDLFPKLIEKNELSYYIHPGSWMDVGG